MFILRTIAIAKSLQLCLTLCYPIDSSPPSSPVLGILQAGTLEWVAISFSNAWKRKVKVKSLSHVCLSDPVDCSPPGPSIYGIFQARVLEWGAIAFSVLSIYVVIIHLPPLTLICSHHHGCYPTPLHTGSSLKTKTFHFSHSQSGLWRAYCLGACWASLNNDICGAWALRKAESSVNPQGTKLLFFFFFFLRTNVNNTVTTALQISRCTAATVSSHGHILRAANVCQILETSCRRNLKHISYILPLRIKKKCASSTTLPASLPFSGSSSPHRLHAFLLLEQERPSLLSFLLVR